MTIKLEIAGQDLELTVEQARELKKQLDLILPYSPHQMPRPNDLPSYPPHGGFWLHTPTYPNNPITCCTQFYPN